MVDLEEKSSQGFELEHYLGIARRHHLHFLAPLFMGWIIVWGVSWMLPPRYKSGTLILVEQPTMPKDYVVPNISDDLQERLQSITQQILSRTRLLHIIEQLHLYEADHGQLSSDEKIERMRKDIDIELVRDAQNRIQAFNVFYTSRDPHIAQRVTSELTNLFINENLEARQQQSESTTKFLESQLADARRSLTDQEGRIREFKGKHVTELPAQLESNIQILNGLQSQLRAEEDAVNTARQQRVYLQALVSEYHALQAPPSTSEPNSVGLPVLDQELDRLKAQLADLSSHYTDRHPDVRKLKEQIAKTEKMRDQLLASLKPNGTGSTEGSSASQATNDLAPPLPLAQLQGQLQSNQIEIANREHSIVELKAKVNEYQIRLNQEPVREQQLADLTRGYDQSKVNYDDLLKKRNESAMATSMELRQQGERFRILDPPSLPLKPEFPNHLKFCGVGLAVGMLLGVVVAGAFEKLDHRLYDEKELRGLLPVAMIVEIPEVISPIDQKLLRKRLWLRWATTGLVFCTILAGSVFSYLHG